MRGTLGKMAHMSFRVSGFISLLLAREGRVMTSRGRERNKDRGRQRGRREVAVQIIYIVICSYIYMYIYL